MNCKSIVKSSSFFKWPGGKKSLLEQILPFVADTSGRYFEPFLGGGALYFALQPRSAVLSDNNEDLINCYIHVRDRPEEVIKCLSKFRNSKEDYYEIRAKIEFNSVKKAARFIYLTSLSFNGIYRLNLKGLFNVPYGYQTNKAVYDAGRIRQASRALSNAKITCNDFEESVRTAGRGDAVYLDPPYTVAHGNNGFVKYNDKIFSWADQIRLANLAKRLAVKGCRVVVSNADHPSILALYKGFKLVRVKRCSVIAASEKFRQTITECLFYNEV